MNKTPIKLPIDTIYKSLTDSQKTEGRISYNERLAVALNVRFFFQDIIHTGEPYLIEDYRMGLVREGRLRTILNLRDESVSAGHIVFITPGTIVEPQEVSEDFCIEGMSIPVEAFHLAHRGNLPEIFQGEMRVGKHEATENEMKVLDRLYRMLYTLVNPDNHIDTEVVHSMVTTITRYFNQIFMQGHDAQPQPVRSKELFTRFLRLVNLNCRNERSLSYYAGRLCITEHYLSSVVSGASGVTAKEWIDRAVITAAKVLLKHSDKQVSQISDELHFPNPSFFCKYFRRIVGCTPQEYRTR